MRAILDQIDKMASLTFRILEILLAVVSTRCIRFYAERQSMAGYMTTLPTLSEHDLTSQSTMCSRLCNRQGNCTSYFENSKRRQCHLMTHLLDAESGNLTKVAGWKYYVLGDCDLDDGYIYDPESSFCVKYFPDKLQVEAAQNRCIEDGGRLVEVRNERQQLVLAGYLVNIEARHGYGPTIAGRRSNSTSPWLFDDGTEAEYFHWDTLASNPEPIDNKNCIKLDSLGSYVKWHNPTIGGRRAGNADPWLFDDGTPIAYTNWNTIAEFAQPITGKHCIKLGINYEDVHYFWSAAMCSRKASFICQVP